MIPRPSIAAPLAALLAALVLAPAAHAASAAPHGDKKEAAEPGGAVTELAPDAAPVRPVDPDGPLAALRALRALQDKIARGDRAAHAAQRHVIGELSVRLLKLPDVTWSDARNSRAAIALVLSGGDPRLLRKIISLHTLKDADVNLAKGALAYAENRRADAAVHLSEIDARTLDASLAGQIALTQSMLVDQEQVEKSLQLLELARLLAPGTLVEEAALRRECVAASAAGKLDRFEQLAARYLRRFPKSVYAASFHKQFAKGLLSEAYASDEVRRANLANMLSELPLNESRNVYLAIAEEGIASGAIEVTRLAVGSVVKALEAGSKEAERVRVYESAALAATEEAERGAATLATIDRSKLERPDIELVNAAISVAAEVQRTPAPLDESAEPPPPVTGIAAKRDKNGVVAAQAAADRALNALDKVDELLNADRK